MTRNCYEDFSRCIGLLRKIAVIWGVDVLDANYKMNLITWLVIIAVNGYFGCTLYTIYVGYVVNGDWKMILQTLSLAGSAVQGISKLYLAIYHHWSLCLLSEKLGKIYKDNQHDESYAVFLTYRSDLVKKIFKFLMCIYFVTWVILNMYPIFYGLWYGEKILIMSFFLPGIDPTTDYGHMIHNGVHFFLVTLGMSGNFAGDSLLIIFITNIPLLRDILKIKCEQLNRVILNEEETKETMPMLKEIIVAHQNYNTFSAEVAEVYNLVIFIEIFTLVMGISFTFFSMVLKSWPAAFIYFVYSFFLLYAYCGLGHLVEVANDEVIDIIYGDILWYELPVIEQKLVLLMLRKSQAAEALTIGKVMPLSMSSALQLTKAIYSYMMMLVNFLETDDM